jgi:hypothetical protein
MKMKFDRFFAFLWSRRPLPFFHGIKRGLAKYGASTDYLRELHFSARRNHSLNLYGSTNVHSFG